METLLRTLKDGKDIVEVIQTDDGDIVVEHRNEIVTNRINLTRMGTSRPEKVDPSIYRKGNLTFVDLGTQSPEGYNPQSMTWEKLPGNTPILTSAEKQIRRTIREFVCKDQEIQPTESGQETLLKVVVDQVSKTPGSLQSNLQTLIGSLLELSQTLGNNGAPSTEENFIHLVEHDGPQITEVHTYPNTPRGEESLQEKAKALLEEHFSEIKETEEEIEDPQNNECTEAFETFRTEDCWKSPTFCLTKI